MLKIINFFFVLLVVSHCATMHRSSMLSNSQSPVILKEEFSFLPENINLKNSSPHGQLLVPSKMLHMGLVIKDVVEVREGPGSQYSLKPFLLKKNDKVIVFERLKKWVRISLPQENKKGWIHFQTFKELTEEKIVSLHSDDLPPLFSAKELKHAYSYATQEKVKFSCPKRTIFFRLKTNKEKVLVWIPNTSYVVWLDKNQAL